MSRKIVTGNTPLECVIYAADNRPHLQQIYTGFKLLQKAGVVKCKYVYDGRKGPLRVQLDGRSTLRFDVSDSYGIDTESLSSADFYFKRDLDPSLADAIAGGEKLYPLGLNYLVYPDTWDTGATARAFRYDKGTNKLWAILRSTAAERFIGLPDIFPRVSNTESHPLLRQEPRILFMTRTYDPDLASNPDEASEWENLNEMRVACIRKLKSEFGKRFYGGLACHENAKRRYSDCLLPDRKLSRKWNYMKMLPCYPICVTTAGLFGSAGWKLSEYVAFSKAIVSEKIFCRLPGNFCEGDNYLSFDSPEQCVERVAELIGNVELRHALMLNNYRYYHSFVRPDSLIMNALMISLRKT